MLTCLAAHDLPEVHTKVEVRSTVQPSVDRRDAEVVQRTLFSRDDQILHVLGAGINAGQHEGGGKSLEIRRFGFNLDHGGVNGGMKVLVENVGQNQTTQGHGQGYLGALKSLSPELVQEVELINGPFSPEYGDFSGLGVVHIRLRESMPDRLTTRLLGGSFQTLRGFAAWSPVVRDGDALLAFEGSNSDGPFLQPLGYRRDNLTASYLKHNGQSSWGTRFNGGTNHFTSSGQLPLDEIESGRLDRFGALDPTQGGRVRQGTGSAWWRREPASGEVWKLDGFLTRSLFDLFSNFTYFLNDPVNGDGIQQHDSRLVEGANAQYLRPYKVRGLTSLFVAGGNYHDNQILVGLDSRLRRTPLERRTRDQARVTNAAAYAQNNVTLLSGRLTLSGGLRHDTFRFRLRNADTAGRLQPKAALAYTPSWRLPLTLHLNYGRGISTADARVLAQRQGSTRIATTDFLQVGAAHKLGRVSASTSLFWIERSHELVYLADDGTSEFTSPSRAWGFESKLSADLNRFVAFHGSITKVFNAYFRQPGEREYVTNAPRFVSSAALTLSSWRGWSGSLRMRSINRYRLDAADPSVLAAGHTVWDAGVARRLRRGLEMSITVDNALNRSYWETQNYYESRLPGQPARARIHATPGYPVTVVAGITWRTGGK